MKCPKCGTENNNTATFCQKCGYKLIRSSGIFQAPTSLRGEAGSGEFSAPVTRQQPGSGSLETGDTSQPESMLPPPPETLKDGRYLVLKQLGAGGMGRVFLARDTTMDFRVVVKEMLPFYTTREDKEYMENRFKEEAKLLFRLKHQNLPRVTDYFIERGSSFLIMEFVEGEDLERVAEGYPNHRVDKKEAVLWMWSVLDILRYLHSQDPPIIHRDIKPANLMLTTKGEIFLVDFGVARSLGKTTLTSVGTPGFASMDHFTGNFSPSSDLYSVGATFHYLLSGENPQERKNFVFPPLNKYRNDIPDNLQLIISKLLALKKEVRYKKADEVMNDLLPIVNQLTGKQPPGINIIASEPATVKGSSSETSKVPSTPKNKTGSSGRMRTAPRPMSRASGKLGDKSGKIKAQAKDTGSMPQGRETGSMPSALHPSAEEIPEPQAAPATREMEKATGSSQQLSAKNQKEAKGKLPKKKSKFLEHLILIVFLIIIPSCWAMSKVVKLVGKAIETEDKSIKNSEKFDDSSFDEPAPDFDNPPVDVGEIEREVNEKLDKELNRQPVKPSKEDFQRLKTFLARHPGKINIKDKSGQSLLHKAALTGEPEFVKFLLNKRIKVNTPDNKGRTPLHIAALTGNPEIVKLLISKRAYVNFQDRNEATPLHYAAGAGNYKAAEILIGKGAKINAKNKQGLTPRDVAQKMGNKKVETLIISKGGKSGGNL